MDTSDRSDHSLVLRNEVLAHPAYQERCHILFDLFRLSREISQVPREILAMQAGLGDVLMQFQDEKVWFKQEHNELGLAIVKRLILILRRIADSIAWRMLGYDRVLIQLLAEHQKTGHLDDTVFNDFTRAQKIVEQEDAIVLVNDLTTVLRYGDLTIIGKDGISYLMETKHGKASSRSRRAIRQRRRLDELISFLNTGVRDNKSRRDFILKADVSVRTHHAAVAEVITQAREKGYHQVIVSDCLAIEALYTGEPGNRLPEEHPFKNEEYVARFHNLQAFDKPKTRIAPYGIFPLDCRDCFDLMTGDVFLIATLNFRRLRARYNQLGLTLDLPRPSGQEVKVYLSAPIAERKKQMYLGRFIIRDGDYRLSLTPDLWGRIGVEFIHEDTIVQADRQLMNLIKNLGIPDDRTTRFYIGYRDESNIWI